MKLSILLLCFISVNSAEPVLNKDITTVDIVLRGLNEQSWSEDEKPCLDQTLLILNNVRNYTVWAVWIWNSMHHPVGTLYGSEYSLGNYDQCLLAPSASADPQIITQYCLADVVLTDKKYEGDGQSVLDSTDNYVTVRTQIRRNLNKVSWGTCLPSVCKHDSIAKILKIIYMANPLTPSEPKITVDSCQVAGAKMEYSTGYYAFIALISLLVAVTVISTYYVWNTNTKTGAIYSIANSFSIKRNWTSLMKKSDSEIGFINLLRVFLAFFAVMCHTALFELVVPYSNGRKFDEMLLDVNSSLKNTIKHVHLAIDIFFAISGLLLIKGLMENKKKPLVALINRYFRFMASFAVVMFYMTSVYVYTGDGPVWQRFASKEQKACSENWWLSLLMMNNYINSDNICLLVSWQIPCDYQLAIMGTILYLIWQKNNPTTKNVTIITVTMFILMPGIVTYWRGLPGMVLYRDIEKLQNFRTNEVFLDTYIRSHNRAGPYLIGMAMGYIMSVYKPDKYRNVISKEISFILLAAASIISMRVLTLPVSWAPLEYDHLSSAAYAVYSRNIWALSSCVLIGVVEYGDFAILRKVTNWHGFSILARLTYGVYLTHSILLNQDYHSTKNLREFDLLHSLIQSFGVFLTSALLAILLWLFVEAPLNNIVNLFTNARSKDESNIKIVEDVTATTNLKENNVDKLKGL